MRKLTAIAKARKALDQAKSDYYKAWDAYMKACDKHLHNKLA